MDFYFTFYKMYDIVKNIRRVAILFLKLKQTKWKFET